ncbi:cytochrome c3 family protein [candidate division CSSED10-310 bacterium]|uniref:Cytochrome c3 family protein n=1 Tax=candidate division CSSED10-310 bacterium TaxID=2855610 RepID=A0ABV6Z248_UNCC1
MKNNFVLLGVILIIVVSSITIGSEHEAQQFIFLLGQDGQFKAKKPLVRFNHDKHTALLKQNCALCHYSNEASKKVCLLVKGSEKIKGDTNVYHAICRDCHKKEVSKYENIPVKCEQCHDKLFEETFQPLRVIFKHGKHILV